MIIAKKIITGREFEYIKRIKNINTLIEFKYIKGLFLLNINTITKIFSNSVYIY